MVKSMDIARIRIPRQMKKQLIAGLIKKTRRGYCGLALVVKQDQ